MEKMVVKGDSIVLIDLTFRKFIIDTNDKTDKYKGVAAIDPGNLLGKQYGKQIEIGNK